MLPQNFSQGGKGGKGSRGSRKTANNTGEGGKRKSVITTMGGVKKTGCSVFRTNLGRNHEEGERLKE